MRDRLKRDGADWACPPRSPACEGGAWGACHLGRPPPRRQDIPTMPAPCRVHEHSAASPGANPAARQLPADASWPACHLGGRNSAPIARLLHLAAGSAPPTVRPQCRAASRRARLRASAMAARQTSKSWRFQAAASCPACRRAHQRTKSCRCSSRLPRPYAASRCCTTSARGRALGRRSRHECGCRPLQAAGAEALVAAATVPPLPPSRLSADRRSSHAPPSSWQVAASLHGAGVQQGALLVHPSAGRMCRPSLLPPARRPCTAACPGPLEGCSLSAALCRR